jgi:pimeloyl-ACP methyl ester carboxylesterase
VTLPAGLQECLVGFGSLGDRSTREAFVHTARSVLDPAGQRVDARDRLYLAADLPLFVVWGRKDAIIPCSHGVALAEQVPGPAWRSSSSRATSRTSPRACGSASCCVSGCATPRPPTSTPRR